MITDGYLGTLIESKECHPALLFVPELKGSLDELINSFQWHQLGTIKLNCPTIPLNELLESIRMLSAWINHSPSHHYSPGRLVIGFQVGWFRNNSQVMNKFGYWFKFFQGNQLTTNSPQFPTNFQVDRFITGPNPLQNDIIPHGPNQLLHW